MGAEIRIATCWDAEQLAATMRPADVAECAAAAGFTPLEALLVSMRWSRGAWALVLDGEVAAMFGVVAVPAQRMTAPDIGHVWVLSGAAVNKRPIAFFKASRAVVKRLAEQFDFLAGEVDARYLESIAWVLRLGFTVHKAVRLGPDHAFFHPITFRSEKWAC